MPLNSEQWTKRKAENPFNRNLPLVIPEVLVQVMYFARIERAHQPADPRRPHKIDRMRPAPLRMYTNRFALCMVVALVVSNSPVCAHTFGNRWTNSRQMWIYDPDDGCSSFWPLPRHSRHFCIPKSNSPLYCPLRRRDKIRWWFRRTSKTICGWPFSVSLDAMDRLSVCYQR